MISLYALAAFAGSPEDEAKVWASRLRQSLSPLSNVTASFFPSAPFALPCATPTGPPPSGLRTSGMEAARARWEADPIAVSEECGRLAFSSWMLRLDLEPVDRRVSATGWLRVARSPAGSSASDQLRRWHQTGVIAAKYGQVLFPFQEHILDIHLPCAASYMLDYEISDLVKGLREATAASDPDFILLSRCGQRHFELLATSELLKRGERETEFFGVRFPEGRDQHRTGTVSDTPARE